MKKIIAIFMTITLVFMLVSQTLAASEMYAAGSGIPDFATVTETTLIDKAYSNGSTIYHYCSTSNYNSVSSYSKALNVFCKELEKNGYTCASINSYTNGYSRIYVNYTTGYIVGLLGLNYDGTYYGVSQFYLTIGKV